MAFATVISLSTSARASAIFTLSDGVNPVISVSDNGAGDYASGTGVLVVETNIGVWNLAINIAVTKPLVGSESSPVMDINLQAYSTAAGTLTLTFSDNNFSAPPGTVNSTITGDTVMGATGLASYSVFGDPGNILGAMTVPITVLPPAPLSPLAETGSGTLNLAAPFSMTQTVEINAGGPTAANLDASFNFTPAPEPGVSALGALGFGGWLLFRMRNRRA
jgi:hypothetical protein